MHRATPSNTSFRSFSAGGTRTCIHSIDDTKQMQEMGGNMMAGENRSSVESPQNYGFTSVTHDPDKDDNGNVTDCAEGFMSFMGGNRSFPVCSVTDDRRHRLNGCQPGDTAMFRGKDDNQQFHMTQDGGFWSADQSKTVRMQLVQGQQQSGAQSRDASSGSGSGNGGGNGQQQKGQKPVYKQGQNSTYYVDVTSAKTTASGQEVHLKLSDKQTYVHCQSANVYLGGENSSSADARSGNFLRVMLEDGSIAQNVWAKIGGGGAGGGGGGPITGANAPLQIQNGVISLLHGLPLSTDVGGIMQLLHAAPLSLSATATKAAGTLGINIAAPLMLDGSSNLTSAIKEAPADGAIYGRIGTLADWRAVVPIAGGTMTGALVLNADPSAALGACTKQYADARAWQEAPQDGYSYGRANAAWGRVVPIAGGTMTGALTLNGAPTAALMAATKGYVDGAVPPSSSSIPSMDGTGNAGSAVAWSRGDHVHPTDISRAPLDSPAFTGVPTAPTPAPTDNSTTLATTAFTGTAIANLSGVYARWVPYTGPPQSFAKSDLTRDGDWTMVANKATSDRPAPQPTGAEEDLLPAWTPATPNARASYTLYNEWTLNQAGWIEQYGVGILQQNINAAAPHAVTLQINGTVHDTFSVVPSAAGTYFHDIIPIVVPSGAVIRVTLQVTQTANNQMYWEEQAGLFATTPPYCSLAQGAKDGAAAGTTAYGCHVLFSPGTVSPDWDVVAHSGAAGGGAGAATGIPDAPSDGTLYGRLNAAWSAVPTGAAGVTTWNARSGDVAMTLADVTGAGGAPLANPTFTGTVSAPTAAPGDSSTIVATTAFVQGEISVIDGGNF